ncbi:hypothetical protein [Paenibacillus sp. HB172176]|uniref:hypothetical protein n=1 Tax=Paenibacillus sp. HB172176 TaxID=2493690 RepID=UPI00143955B2|nr:hypothetical protein [Paenibacillus sp. HB172176]
MLSVTLNDSQFPSDGPGHLAITRIEVFVIPALAIDANGYRVCLRLTTDFGIGWNEQFVCENDSSFDLEAWRAPLQSFVGRFPLSSLTDRLTERITGCADQLDNRALEMFVAALDQLRFKEAAISTITTNSGNIEESVLQQRAKAYLSLD